VTRRSNKGPLRKYTLLRSIGIERLRKKRLSVPGAFSSCAPSMGAVLRV
jgi:hypothetical protein